MAAPLVGSESAAVAAADTELTVAVPAGTLAGHHMFLFVFTDSSPVALDPDPTTYGWDFASGLSFPGTPTLSIFHKVADGPPTGSMGDEPVDYTIEVSVLATLLMASIVTFDETVTYATPAGRNDFDGANDAGGDPHSFDLHLDEGTDPMDHNLLFYVMGFQAAYAQTPTVVFTPGVDWIEAVPRWSETFDGGGAGPDDLTYCSAQVFYLPVESAVGQPEVDCNISYTDTFHANSRNFVLELTGFEYEPPAPPVQGSSPLELPQTRLNLKVLPNKVTRALLDGFDG